MVGVIPITASHAGWFSYDSYEDCMLGRMKGQNSMMYEAADKACKKQFGIEFDISSSVKWKFYQTGHLGVISISEVPDEYEITSGEFSFSAKSCEGLTAADFGEPVTLRFVGGKANLPVYMNMNNTSCAHAISFKAKYK
jgi:hypothetical protein